MAREFHHGVVGGTSGRREENALEVMLRQFKECRGCLNGLAVRSPEKRQVGGCFQFIGY
ncbi:hypothetical protein StoSoilB13_23240 [Arthrobacter sp. StoSoilB13]|nr:hypothetical protein StoSoilB13_23240 [Arthrobacter sp. StoSoilB13]